MLKDPVCGMQLDEMKEPKSPRTIYKGAEYAFCGNECKGKFERNPEQYCAKPQTQQANR